MKKLLQLSVISILLGLSTVALADTKIAVFDQLAALTQSNQAKAMIQKMKSDLSPDEKKLKTMGESLEKTGKQLETDSAVMSEAQRQKAGKDFEKRRADFFALQQSLQKRYQDGQQRVVQTMTPKLKQALEQVIKKGGYSLVVQKQAMIYVADGLDITDDVITAINAGK